MKVFVVDAAGNPLKEGSTIELRDEAKTSGISKMDDKGLVDLTIKANTYWFTSERPEYFKQKVTTTISKDQEEVTLVMAKIPYGLEVYQAIIYYDLDKDFLRELSKEKLDEIYLWMIKYPELNLLIESHTDSRASDRYNQRLSERRARSVTKYLEEKGASGDRVSAAWFSEAKLVNNCGDGVPCPEPNHQLNRHSELKLIASPDPNKNYDLPLGAAPTDFVSKESVLKWFKKP